MNPKYSTQDLRTQNFLDALPISQYCAYTQDSASIQLALRLIARYEFEHSVHINRTRFWVPHSHTAHSFVALRFTCIDHESDHQLGI